MKFLAAIALCLALLAGCNRLPLEVFTFEKEGMHTVWSYSLVGRDESKARAAFEKAAAEVDRLDNLLAMWKEDSEIAKANSRAGLAAEGASGYVEATILSSDTIQAAEAAWMAAEWTQGAFDPTVGPLTTLWYYKLQKKELPSPGEIQGALQFVDYRKVRLLSKFGKEGSVSMRKGFKVDLGGVSKGYAQDKVASLIRDEGFDSFLLNAGGQVYAAGTKPGDEAWKVGILNPRVPGQLATIIFLENQAMATSGDYEQFTEIDGRRYHHILDPRSGRPAAAGIGSSTVIVSLNRHKNAAALVDALATASLVMGVDAAKALLEKRHFSGIWITENELGALQAVTTADLDDKLEFAF